jgi:DNA-binding transcriptional LysR family regulator
MDGAFTELRYFNELAKHASITAASRALGITQPSLSLAIQRLEVMIGASLLIRTKKGIELTRAGKELLFRSNKLVEYWEDVKTISSNTMTEVQGQIKLGCHASVGLFTLKYFLPGFIKKYPLIDFDIDHELSSKINQRIIDLELDLGIVVNPISHPDLVITKLFTDEVCLWQKEKNSQPTTLICDKNLKQSQDLIKQLTKKKINFDKIITCSSLENITNLVDAGVGIGIIPTRVVRESKKKLVKVVGGAVFKDEFAVVYRVEQKKVRAITELVKYIKKVFS